MSTLLDGKVALVTGASRGIGRAIALRFAHAGALVAVHYAQNRDAATEVVDKIKAAGGKAFSVQAQLSDLDSVIQLYAALDQALTEQIGTHQFDILVNNAGILSRGAIEEVTEKLFDEAIAVNLKAPFFLIQKALPRLRDGGRIINLSSGVTQVATPGVIAYAAAKGAINTVTRTLAAQLGKRGITVNAIAPGVTETDMANWVRNPESQAFIAGKTALGRVGQSDDIADVALFLASPDSRWITGQYLDVSGGFNL